nr:hypothetical protein [Tanacetum cinerariifolium]
MVNDVKGVQGNWGNPQHALKDKGVIDSGCSRGLPTKVFENDHSCVACKKGKQHRASCKSKPVNSVDQLLFRLHMDLFGPTFVKSINKKSYCLVIIDDYSRFTWVFFLASKDETSPILKTFITGLENQLSLRVKVIRSDNRTEFKNSDLNQFCGLKGIKREFSVPKTPQQNGIAERKNKTLIEATRTMLADSLLPIPFWAEAVNTACYVQNRVLVTKPHNKTTYELLHGRTPSIGFMRPFGCPVTILNTLDHLGKFQEKETLHVNFLENKSNVAGAGPTWLFDIGSLSRTMNYHPVSIANQTNSGDNDKDALVDGKEHGVDIQKSMSADIHSSSSSAQTRKQADKTEREDKGKSPVESFTGYMDLNVEFEDCSNNCSNGVNAASSSCDGVGSYDWSFQVEEEPTNYALMAFTSSSSSSSDNELRDNALVVLRQKFKKAEQERDVLKLKLEKFQTSSKNLSQLLSSQTNDKTGLGYGTQVFTSSMFACDEVFSSESDVSMPASPIYNRYKSGEGYYVVPPTHTGTFMPPKPDLVFHDALTVNKTVHTAFNVKLSPTKPDKDLSHRPSAPIIEDWVSDLEDESEADPLQNNPSFVQPTEQVKTLRPSVKPVEHPIPAANLKIVIPKTKTHGNSKNRKACFVCMSLAHLIKDCDYYGKKMAQTPARNHAQSENHQHYASMTHLNPQRHVVPTAVLTRSKLVPLTAVRPVTIVVPQNNVTRPRPVKTDVTKPHSPLRRNINRRPSPNSSNFPLEYTTVKAPKVNVVKGVQENWLPDEKQVLLRVPRENNMYNVDLKKIVPSGDLTCLFAKATLDESNLWHRRLGHINFKTMNKLVEGNLVRGLPSKVFENNHTCVACKKGNLHRASCKTKPISSVSQPLQRVLVTKPHNKTPYELLLGRTPSIDFMRPFGCPVTILNTLDPLEKAGEENVQQYVLFPLWSFGSKDPQNTDIDATFEVKEPEFKVEKPESKVHVSPSNSAKTKKHVDKTKR